jgi:hypothetical protein
MILRFASLYHIIAFFGFLMLVQAEIHSANGLPLDSRLTMSADYLEQQILDDGMFNYWVNLNEDVKMSTRYNALRHAGSIYALCQYYQDSTELSGSLAIASRLLKDKFIAPVYSNDGVLAVWSTPETTMNVSVPQAKLGGAGLGLVALLSFEKLNPGSTDLQILEGLGRFIFFMQKEDGSFYSKFIPATGGLNDEWTSLYYPGEAALGLIMLYDHADDEVWLNCAIKALSFLAASRAEDEQLPADHWALLATAKLFELKGAEMSNGTKDLLMKHALQVCRSIVNEQLVDSHVDEFIGGFTYDGRTTPTATRLEGLLATLEWLSEDHPDYSSIEASIHLGMKFLLRAQITEGEFAGGFPRAVKLAPNWVDGAEKFNQRATEIRIDYVQHALSAMIQYKNFLRRDPVNRRMNEEFARTLEYCFLSTDLRHTNTYETND